jgi:hypothetical protein
MRSAIWVRLLVASAVVCTLVACSAKNLGTGGTGGGGGSGSCSTFTSQCSCNNTPSSGALNGTCDEYAGAAYCQPDGGSEAQGCVSGGPACPTSNRVGTCWPPQFDSIDTATRYYSPTYTTATAQAACQQTGACFLPN